MKPADLLLLLNEIYRDKSALRARHVAGARLVGNYDFNNTYQYVINREDVHLSWLRRKLGETAAEPRYLHSVRGVGVRLVAPAGEL